MKKEYLIALGVLAVGAYLYYDKKKKDELKPYSDAELDKVLKDFTHLIATCQHLLQRKIVK